MHRLTREFPTALGLLAVILLILWKIVFTSQYSILSGPDNVYQTYSWAEFAGGEVREGRIPLWNPYTHSGTTFLGELQTGAFGPFQALTYPWPGNSSGRLSTDVLEGAIVLAYWVSGLLMFALARRLGLHRFAAFLTAVMFLFSGFMGTRPTQQANVFFSAVWLPGIFLFYLSSLQAKDWFGRLAGAALAGLFLALSILSGHHHPGGLALLALGICSLFWVWKSRPLGKSATAWVMLLPAVVAIAGFLLAAVQVFPTLEYAQRAVRWAPDVVLPGEEVRLPTLQNDHIVRPHALLGFFFPVLDDSTDGAVYFGVLPLILATLSLRRFAESRWVQLFCLLAALSVIYSLGQFSLLHGVANVLLPELDKLREAIRALLITHFSLALLAGFGFQYLLEAGWASVPRVLLKTIQWVVIAGVGGWMVALVLYRTVAGKPLPYFIESLLLSLIFIAISGALLALWRRRRINASALSTAVLLLLLFDYGHFVGHTYHSKEKVKEYPSAVFKSTPVVDFLSRQIGLFRIHDPERLLPSNLGNVYKLQTTWGYGATALESYWRFFLRIDGSDSPFLDLLNVRYVVSSRPVPGWEDVFFDPASGHHVFENPAAFPRAWIVYEAVHTASFDEAMKAIEEKRYDLREHALLQVEGTAETRSRPDAGSAQVEIKSWKPGAIEVETQSPHPGYLVLSEISYPGWSAEVAGREVAAVTADGVLMAFPLDAGLQRWQIRYRPASLQWGLWCSVICGAALLIASIWRARPFRRRGPMNVASPPQE